MQKYIPIYIYGSIIILIGLFLTTSASNSFMSLKLTIGILLLIGAIFAFISAFSRQRKYVQFAYHEMHAIAMLVYGIALIFFCNSSESLVSFTAFLFLFYGFSEIIFGNWLFNLAQTVVLEVALIRVILGLVIGIGAIVAMEYKAHTFQLFGVLFILVGVNIMLYVPVMKQK